jgi:murein DD-endopeptidase MepM/ murein hydrolase activator NlpD
MVELATEAQIRSAPSLMNPPQHRIAERPEAVVTEAARSGYRFDVGHEPPLDESGGDGGLVDRRGVNLRWLGASVLTGLTGAALLGAAIFVAMEGDTTFAELPERAAPGPARGGVEDRAVTALGKGDKLVRTEMVVSAKQDFRAPISIRVGDREVIRNRPFVRIATSLSLTSGVYARNIPAFDPLRFFAEEGAERFAEAVGEAPADAEVSVVKHDLTALPIDGTAPALKDDDAAAQIEEERRLTPDASRRTPIALPPQMLLSRTLQQPAAPALQGYAAIDVPFSSIEVRVVPENVTTQSKIDARAVDVEDRGVALKRGETLETVLRANGATPDQVRTLLNALGGRARANSLPEGQQMRILVGPVRSGEPRQILRVILFGENGIEAIAAANDRGGFVSVSLPEAPGRRVATRRPAARDDEEDDGEGVSLYESLFETALKHDLPRQTVDELIRIFGYDVDFQRRVSSGDSFEIFYTTDEENGDRPEVLFASLSIAGEPRRVFRFQSPEDGSIDFFDEQGRSLKKFLMRKPIAEGQLRSGFGMRRHPILGYSKLHSGVDWSNRIGTPIMAAGNGTVQKAEWDSGYGRRVELQHANGYVTTYSHMSRFARGIQPGARVRQGQIIGYVGNTGLSTGPHLHYEVVVNGHFVDPMKIRVPRGRELDGRLLAEFRRQREQTEGLLQRAGSSSRFAQHETR